MTEIVVIGNCQAAQIVTALRLLNPAMTFSFVRVGTPALGTVDPGKLIFLQSGYDSLRERFPEAVTYPRIIFPGFHPDAVQLDKRKIPSPAGGHWHSALALAGFQNGWSVERTLELFRPEVFEAVGYFDTWDVARHWLLDAGAATDIPIARYFFDWCSRGRFMHAPNHPMPLVFADLAIALARFAGLAIRDIRPETFMADRLHMLGVWPVYPAIAERLGLADGSYYFRSPSSFWKDDETKGLTENVRVLDLEAFVATCFARYRKADPALLACARLADGSFMRAIEEAAPAPAQAPPAGLVGNPYAGLADTQFWRRAVANVATGDVDPVLDPKFGISRKDRIATAGSCFAQHISAELTRQGANYFVTEPGPPDATREAAAARNYGVYSARFGNIYTVRQAVQLFDRAFGFFTPDEPDWVRADGRLVDPFRPQIEPDGFASHDALIEDRTVHLAAVARMFRELDVFVFTLGLTEGWRSKVTGAVYPVAPGVSSGSMDDRLHEFVNFTTVETSRDLRGLVERLKSVNRNCRIMLTVSPVSLVATYEKRHVLTSTVASKAVLRAAAGEAATMAEVEYFPAYEIIAGGFNRGAYLGEDCREVLPAGVAHVMRVFCRHYLAAPDLQQLKVSRKRETDERTARDIADVAGVICDEELLDAP